MSERSVVQTVGGLAAVVGGLLWAVKSLSILATGWQPPVLIEAAVPFFGVTVISLASTAEPDRRLRLAQALGAFAVVAGSAAVVSELVGDVWGPVLAAANLAVLVGLVLAGSRLRKAPAPTGATGTTALWLGIATVPALFVGGLLAMINERLLEVPLAVLGFAWLWLGLQILRSTRVSGRPQPSAGAPYSP